MAKNTAAEEVDNLASAVGMEYSEAERFAVLEHIEKQLAAFETLNGVDVSDIDLSTEDIHVKRRGKL